MAVLIGLTDDNRLVSFDSNNPAEVTFISVTGIEGTLIGIDKRPANGLIYGLTTANNLYTLNPNGFDSGTFEGTFTLTDDEEALLRNNALYVNLHTQNFNGGELRGQINIPTGSNIVTGIPIQESQEVGDVVPPDSPATGSFNVTYDDATNSLTVSGTFDNLTSSLFPVGPEADVEGNPRSAIHIHNGVAGENGPIVRSLTPSDAVATQVSTLSVPFEGGTISGLDFNPVPDRLRLVGDNDQNFRINVDTGEVIVDGTLAFAANDGNAGANPNVTAAAYTNSVAGATSTQLFNIDSALNTLLLQNPPNDGTQVTIGNLGVDFDLLGGFDIASSADGSNTAFAVSNSMLYNIDLATGTATNLGMIGDDPNLNLQGLTVTDALTGDAAFDPAQYLASNLDLVAVFGYDLNAATQHYQQFGMNENRPVDTFDEGRYLASNGDLIEVFGFNLPLATEHYVRFGATEGRSTDFFNPVSYLNVNSDLQAIFGNDLAAATQHFIESGFSEGLVF